MKEGRREGGKEGRREGGKEGRRRKLLTLRLSFVPRSALSSLPRP